MYLQEDRTALSLIKQERVDSCGVDLKVEQNISSESRPTGKFQCRY